MSKEIYKEYVVKYWVESTTDKEKTRVNQGYTFGAGRRTVTGIYSDSDNSSHMFFKCRISEVESFKRAPKKHNINGHEVVAPRYDGDFTPEFWVIDASMDGGVNYLRSTELQQETISNLVNNGWFDNSKSALAYTKALLGSK